MVKNMKIEPNSKGIDTVINPKHIKTTTPGPETAAGDGESNMASGDKPTGNKNDSLLGDK